MKHFRNLFFIFLLAGLCLTSCGKEDKNTDEKAVEDQNSAEKKTIYASFFL